QPATPSPRLSGGPGYRTGSRQSRSLKGRGPRRWLRVTAGSGQSSPAQLRVRRLFARPPHQCRVRHRLPVPREWIRVSVDSKFTSNKIHGVLESIRLSQFRHLTNSGEWGSLGSNLPSARHILIIRHTGTELERS